MHRYHLYVWTHDEGRRYAFDPSLGQICVWDTVNKVYLTTDGYTQSTAEWAYESEWKKSVKRGAVDSEILHIIECGYLVGRSD